jgi:hypothetical protein
MMRESALRVEAKFQLQWSWPLAVVVGVAEGEWRCAGLVGGGGGEEVQG